MRRLLPAIVWVCLLVSVATGAPGPPSGLQIGGDTTPAFPGQPAGLSIDVPEVELTLPNLVAGGYENGSVEWSAECTNVRGNIAHVRLYADGVAVGLADATPPYGGAWATGYSSDTADVLTARCTTTDGAIGTSAPAPVTIDVTPPALTNLAAISVTDADAILDYTLAEASSGVTSINFYRCNPAPCTPTLWQSTFDKPLVVTSLLQGVTYNFEAQAADAVGNVSAPSNRIAVTLAEPEESEPVPAFSVSSGSSLCQATASTCSFSYTQPVDADKIILLWGAEDGGTAFSLSSITYGGTAMTTATQAASPNALIKSGVAYLDALPAPGARTVVLTFNEAVNDIAVVVISAVGVESGGPIDSKTSVNNLAASATLNLVGVESTDLITAIAVLDDNAADDSWSVGAGQTELFDSSFGIGTPSAVMSGSYAVGTPSVSATASGAASRFAMIAHAWRTRAVTPTLHVGLSAVPTAIESGGSSTLSWDVSGATSCTATGGWSGSKTTAGASESVSPATTTTYTLSCTGATGTDQDSVTVTVNPASPPPTGDDFYVATTGSNTNPGTLASPWRNIDFAWDQLDPGDTLHIRAGTYTECIVGDDSGAIGNPITIRNYQSEVVTISDSAAPACARLLYGLHLKYLTIQGLRFHDTGVASEGIVCHGACESVRVLNNTVTKDDPESKGNAIFFRDRVGSGAGTVHYHGFDIEIHGNTIVYPVVGPDSTAQQDLVVTGGFSRVKITNNTLDNVNNIGIDLIGKSATAWKAFTGATATPVDPVWPNQVYIKGNTVKNGGQSGSNTAIYLDGARDVVIEDNQAFNNIGNGVTVSTEDASFETRNIITRRNRLWNNTFGMRPGGIENPVAGARAAHNTIYGSKTNMRSIALGGGTNVSLKNNLSLVVDVSGTHHSIHHSGQAGSPLLNYQLYWPDGASNSWGYKTGSYATFAAYKTGSAQDANAVLANPLLVNPGAGNFELGTGSAAIDAGSALTQTNGAGSGTVIVVDDARWFCDGYGIAGISGDTIRVGADTVTVVDMNYTTNTLTVSPSISWADNEPVSYPWLGAGPDIGWHEKQ
jgi:Right handed beta helix region